MQPRIWLNDLSLHRNELRAHNVVGLDYIKLDEWIFPHITVHCIQNGWLLE